MFENLHGAQPSPKGSEVLGITTNSSKRKVEVEFSIVDVDSFKDILWSELTLRAHVFQMKEELILALIKDRALLGVELIFVDLGIDGQSTYGLDSVSFDQFPKYKCGRSDGEDNIY